MVAKKNFVTLGSTGLNRFGGRVYEEKIPQLRSPEIANRVFCEMADNDPILYTIESLCRQVEWRVEPADEEEASVDNAEFLESCIEDMSHTWDDLISEILTMNIFGWSYFEIVYKMRSGRTGNAKTHSRFTQVPGNADQLGIRR